ncbi:MAG TPA: lysophospholipid acyltransferase family protein [Stellaceae bacterium]|nr:lysophospholipid acyltransferase family protein [Stellaceae bacterium]
MARARRVLRSTAALWVMRRILYFYIRAVYATTRWTVEGEEIGHHINDTGRSALVAFWHGRILMMPMLWGRFTTARTTRREATMHILSSSHSDGRFMSGISALFKMSTIFVSPTRIGSEALRTMVRVLKSGSYISMTPDGPNGPSMHANPGIVVVAKLAGVPIVPMTYATHHRRILPTWDSFHLPLPFGRGIFLLGDPIEIPSSLDEAGIENWRTILETRLNALTAEADRRMGHAPVAPNQLDRKSWQAMRRAQRAKS